MPDRLRRICLLAVLGLASARYAFADPAHRYDKADAAWARSEAHKREFDRLKAARDARHAAQSAEIEARQAARKAWLEESWKLHGHPGPRPAPLSAETQAELHRHAGAAFDYGESAYENARAKAELDRNVDDMEWQIERGQIESLYGLWPDE